MLRTTLLLVVPVITVSFQLCGAGAMVRSSFIVAASRFSPALLHEKQDVQDKIAELKASWQRSYAESGEKEPSEEQFLEWAEDTLTEEARRKEVLKSLEAQLAESDAEALAYWNSPEMVAAREAKKAAKETAEEDGQ